MLLALILTLPRLPKDKASFLRRSKGSGVDAKRDKAGVGEKGGHAGRHTASPEVSSPCGPEVDGNCRSVTSVLGSREAPAQLPGVMGITVASRGRCPQDCRTDLPISSLGYPGEAADRQPLPFLRVPIGQETGGRILRGLPATSHCVPALPVQSQVLSMTSLFPPELSAFLICALCLGTQQSPRGSLWPEALSLVSPKLQSRHLCQEGLTDASPWAAVCLSWSSFRWAR